MNSDLFENLLHLLKKSNYSNEQIMHRIQVTIGSAGSVSTSQLNKLMSFFSSDFDKLELAKMAYGYVSDRNSYHHIINKPFASNQTKTLLSQFINRQ